jgi:hypothetical protein
VDSDGDQSVGQVAAAALIGTLQDEEGHRPRPLANRRLQPLGHLSQKGTTSPVT